jgi:sRNA-binding protein
LKVTLGTLKDKGEELATFLEPRVGGKPSLEGGAIEIEDGSVREGVKPRHVKTYIKRFLYMKGVRKNYRVFVSGKELTIQEIVLGEEKEKELEEKEKEVKEKEKEEKEEKKEEAAKPEEAKEEAPEAEAPEAEAKPSKPKKAAPKKPKTKKKKTEDSE